MIKDNRPLLLRNRDMGLLWFGQLLSQSGTKMYQIAILWWVLKSAGSRPGLYLGLVMAASALPSILFVGLMGRVVDSCRTRSLLIACDLLSFVVASAVAAGLYTTTLNLPAVLLASFLLALIQGFFDPALSKAVPQIVDPDDVEGGVALEYSTQSIASFGGAVAGAVLIDAVGIPASVAANGISFLISALSNLLVRYRHVGTPSAEAAPATSTGWRILDDLPVLKRVLIGFGLVNFFITPTVVILPLYTDLALHRTARTLSILEASLWLGLVCGTFATPLVAFIKSTLRLSVACIFTVGTCLLMPGLVVNRTLYVLALFGVGVGLGINNVRFITLFQTVVPDDLKGRFFAVMQAIISFTYPISYLVFGLASHSLSPPGLCLLQGAGTLALTVYFLRLLPREHELGVVQVAVP